MAELKVFPVASRQHRRQFLELPWQIYRGDPNWIPPLRQNQKEMVGYAPNAFYEQNRIQTFLATRDGVPCGRIAAIVNVGHNERYGEKRGFFGFFETVDDPAVAHRLFDAVRDWLLPQGITSVRGPCNPSLNYELGLLVEGFDSPPTFMMTYNPPYYEGLVEAYGFRKTQDLYSYVGHVSILPKVSQKYGHIADQLIEHHGVRLRSLNPKRFTEDVAAFLDVYNRSLVNTWGFVPMSDGELRHMTNGLKRLIVPELALAAEINGEIIGAVFVIPDYNPRIRQIDGRLFPFGFIRLLWNKRKIKRIRVVSTNVVPEYQRLGVGLVLLHGLVPRAMEYGIEEAEFSWVLESNKLSRGSLEKGGATRDKTFRLYDLDLQPAKETQST